MDARRKQSWRGTLGLSLTFYYWLFSGYGERQGLALVWLLLILIGFAGLYMCIGFPHEQTVGFSQRLWQASVYSLGVMTRQRFVDEPEPGLVQFVVILEGILGPLQIALFGLALRRKFMTS
jgi:hypothetical protein